jgi:hypothetical protein
VVQRAVAAAKDIVGERTNDRDFSISLLGIYIVKKKASAVTIHA